MTLKSYGQDALPRYAEHADLDEASAAIVAQAGISEAAKWWDQDSRRTEAITPL